MGKKIIPQTLLRRAQQELMDLDALVGGRVSVPKEQAQSTVRVIVLDGWPRKTIGKP